MEIFYNNWFLFYLLPMLLHLVLTWYSHLHLNSTEFKEWIGDNKKYFEEEYFPVDEISTVGVRALVISFIPILNIVSCAVYFGYFAWDIIESLLPTKKD